MLFVNFVPKDERGVLFVIFLVHLFDFHALSLTVYYSTRIDFDIKFSRKTDYIKKFKNWTLILHHYYCFSWKYVTKVLSLVVADCYFKKLESVINRKSSMSRNIKTRCANTHFFVEAKGNASFEIFELTQFLAINWFSC